MADIDRSIQNESNHHHMVLDSGKQKRVNMPRLKQLIANLVWFPDHPSYRRWVERLWFVGLALTLVTLLLVFVKAGGLPVPYALWPTMLVFLLGILVFQVWACWRATDPTLRSERIQRLQGFIQTPDPRALSELIDGIASREPVVRETATKALYALASSNVQSRPGQLRKSQVR